MDVELQILKHLARDAHPTVAIVDKQYLSEHRNDQQAFQSALEILMSRRNPANRQPYPFDLANPKTEVEAIFRKKLKVGLKLPIVDLRKIYFNFKLLL